MDSLSPGNDHRSGMTDLTQTIEAAVQYHTQGCLTEAVQCLREAIAQNPNQANLYINLGAALRSQGHTQQAQEAYQQAIAMNPQSSEAPYNLANLFKAQGSLEQAIIHYKHALRLKPDFAGAFFNLANIYNTLGDLTQARECYELALERRPDFPKALHHLGLLLKKTGSLSEAIHYFKKAITYDPHYAVAYNNLGNALQESGQWQQAVTCYKQACMIHPSFKEAHYNCANVLSLHHQGAAALIEYEQVIQLQPDHVGAHYNRGLLLLQRGDYPEGWREYHWRLKVKTGPLRYPHAYEQTRWQGQPFPDQRILVHCEQGLGDTIQFARFLSLVKARGGTLLFEVWDSLGVLFSNDPSIDEIITYNPHKKTNHTFDYVISILDLPMVFNTDINTIPQSIPYIHPDTNKVHAWQTQCDTKDVKVGIVWAGNPSHPDDQNRSCDLHHFQPLTQIPKVQLYSLQKGDRAAELLHIPEFNNTVDCASACTDFSDTAAVLAHMDLILSVDTAVAHLAGAMGKPVWILLPYGPDWRWMLHRDDSPWYPSATLFRQHRPQDWTSVFEQVTSRLQEMANKNSRI